MKNIFKSIAVVLLIFSTSGLAVQTGVTNFTLNSSSVQTAGQHIIISSTISKIGNSIEWHQFNDGDINLTSFAIIGTSGSWNESASLGSVTYTLDIEGYRSELILTGHENGISATLISKITETQEEVYIFNIDTITYQ